MESLWYLYGMKEGGEWTIHNVAAVSVQSCQLRGRVGKPYLPLRDRWIRWLGDEWAAGWLGWERLPETCFL